MKEGLLKRKKKVKCSYFYLFVFWLLVLPWFIYNYFFGENSVAELKRLEQTRRLLEKEAEYWKFRNEVMEEKISALKKNKKFYYEKLAREMFVKGKPGEEVILFVGKPEKNF